MNTIADVNFDIVIFNLNEGIYRYIGSGSGRRVFDLENGYVVKVAKNRKGIAQNKAEHEISLSDYSNLFAKIPKVSEDYRLLIMEKAERISNFSDIYQYFNVKNYRQLYQLEQIKDNLSKHNIIPNDIFRTNSWGKINNRPVIVDYGFTYSVKRKYYSLF